MLFVRELRGDIPWKLELQDNIDARVNYLLHIRTPQNQWPLGLNGGDKRNAAGLHGNHLSLNLYRQPEHRAIVRAMQERGATRASALTSASAAARRSASSPRPGPTRR